MDPTRETRLQFQKYFEYAQGWLLLENVEEAARSLARIPADYRERPEVRRLRLDVFLAAGQWREAVPLARQLVEAEPGEVGHWISLAYALRRAESLPPAEEVLGEASRRFPACALIWFNLACYAAQQGRLAEARTLLATALRLEPAMEELARTDADLQPLREADAAGPG